MVGGLSMFISCETYYEQYLGDLCDKKCEQCFGDKEIYVCKENFFVTGEIILDKVKIEKGSWFWIKFENDSHVCLECGDDKELLITHEIFNKYFVL